MEDSFSMDQGLVGGDGFRMIQVLTLTVYFISNLALPLISQQVLVHGLDVRDPCPS